MTYYAIITRHQDDRAPHRWVPGRHVYDTRAAAVEAAKAEWDDTGVIWGLMTIPGEEG